MNTYNRERLAEIAATSAVVAVLAVVLSLGALFLDRRDRENVSALLLAMAGETSLAEGQGQSLTTSPVASSSYGAIRRAFLFRDRGGSPVGIGVSIRANLLDWETELLVITDTKGQIRAVRARPGSPGLPAEELEAYVRDKGTPRDLDAIGDTATLEFGISTALKTAADLARSLGEEK